MTFSFIELNAFNMIGVPSPWFVVVALYVEEEVHQRIAAAGT